MIHGKCWQLKLSPKSHYIISNPQVSTLDGIKSIKSPVGKAIKSFAI